MRADRVRFARRFVNVPSETSPRNRLHVRENQKKKIITFVGLAQNQKAGQVDVVV